MGVESLLIAVHVVAAIAITVLVLMQRGKGAEMGASFGSGASQTMFGSLGSGNFLTKSTTVLVVVFFATSLGLAIVAKQRAQVTVQEESLLSGDIEQIVPDASQEADVPVVENAGAGDVPSAGTAGDEEPAE